MTNHTFTAPTLLAAWMIQAMALVNAREALEEWLG